MNAKMLACHDCDLLQQERQLEPGQTARCARCSAVLYRGSRDSLERTIFLAITAVICFAILKSFFLLAFKLEGRVLENTLIAGVIELNLQGMWMIAGLVLLVSIGMPILRFLGLLYVLLPLRFGVRPPRAARVFRVTEAMHPWVMIDVYMLGLLVAITKLSQLADIVPDIALYALVGLMVCSAALDAVFDPRLAWRRLGEHS